MPTVRFVLGSHSHSLLLLLPHFQCDPVSTKVDINLINSQCFNLKSDTEISFPNRSFISLHWIFHKMLPEFQLLSENLLTRQDRWLYPVWITSIISNCTYRTQSVNSFAIASHSIGFVTSFSIAMEGFHAWPLYNTKSSYLVPWDQHNIHGLSPMCFVHTLGCHDCAQHLQLWLGKNGIVIEDAVEYSSGMKVVVAANQSMAFSSRHE